MRSDWLIRSIHLPVGCTLTSVCLFVFFLGGTKLKRRGTKNNNKLVCISLMRLVMHNGILEIILQRFGDSKIQHKLSFFKLFWRQKRKPFKCFWRAKHVHVESFNKFLFLCKVLRTKFFCSKNIEDNS